MVRVSSVEPTTPELASTVELERCAVVGGGRVGTALVRALPGIAGPFGRGFDGGEFDIVVLAVPDREIAAAARCVVPAAGRLVGHCSGATSLSVLAPHEGFGLHPLMTISSTPCTGSVSPPGVSPFDGAPAAVAGTTERSIGVARGLARLLGMVPFTIADRDRAAYHAAASIASNFLVTIMDAADVLARTAALDRTVLVPLIRTTVDNWAAGGRASLTGPVARGDTATVARQREAVAERTPELLALFDVLVDRTRVIAGSSAG